MSNPFQKSLRFLTIPVLCFSALLLNAQDEDALMIRRIHDEALVRGKAYSWLSDLCTQYGPRIAGSDTYLGAASYSKRILSSIDGVSASLQECEATYWSRGMKEEVFMELPGAGRIRLRAFSLGNSVGTDGMEITGEVVEVRSLDEVENLGTEKIKGKIVFFNRPMDPAQIRTFSAYGGAVDQRVYGPSKAAEYGAVAALVRSMTTRTDTFPHTGVTVYKENVNPIPGIAISTQDADLLSKAVENGSVSVSVRTNCKTIGPKPAPSVIGEMRGSSHPEEIILIGGHLDSWDVGQGAHDDGAGCMQAAEVLRILQGIGYKPRRTIRCVLFSNEENGLAGGKVYAARSNEAAEFHLAAIESDAGGFSPRGFSFEADTSRFRSYYKKVSSWLPLLESYGLSFEMGGSGADISPLKSQKGLLIGLRPDSQRYFDFHHTAADRIENVNQRELELGAAAMASLVFLIDKYGLQ
jgi:hypothetical protein